MSIVATNAANAARPHVPVMLAEVLATLAPAADEIYVDGTFGAGGYSRALLQAANCRVVAIDRDPDAARTAERLAQEFPGRFVFLAGCFSDMVTLLAAQGIHQVHGVVLDIGVSSMQLDEAARGFSFLRDGPLDMRMAQDGMSAADIVNHTAEGDLADMLYRYGEERQSRQIARAIVQARTEAPITTTLQLAEIIRRAARGAKPGIHPATKSFQALRIVVNDELGELERALDAATELLAPGGRLVVVSFHSLEDRIVKQFMATHSGKEEGASRHMPGVSASSAPAMFDLPRPHKYAPSDAECAINPRARSARLRVAIRTAQPVRRAA